MACQGIRKINFGSLISKTGSLALFRSWVSVLLDTKRMHTHRECNIHVMVFCFSFIFVSM